MAACFYAFFVEIVIHKDMKFARGQAGDRLLGGDLGDAAGDRGRGASVLRRVPDLRPGARQGGQRRGGEHHQSPWVFLLAVNGLLLVVVGMFMDIISATLILTPIFLPLLSTSTISTPCTSAC
ncbi:MAG: TRAP transporter large permease subunit [Anaerotruncus sp.]|nr:TRAP transporter large permease subunit [Anaerotruncus sp.]